MGRKTSQRWVRFAAQAWESALDGLLPRRCFVCGDGDVVDARRNGPSDGIDVCAAHRIERGLSSSDLHSDSPGVVRCFRCLDRLPEGIAAGERCRACRQRPPSFVAAKAAFLYSEPGVSDWVLRLKHGARPDLAQPLGRMMLAALGGDSNGGPVQGDLLVPVPLHSARLAERGYNQAALIARELARGVGGHYLPILERLRSTFVQGEFAAPSRRLNVQGAFRTVPSVDLRTVVSRAGRIWLVDDVITTGATASACAAALRKAGGGEIRVLAVARA